MFARLGQGYSLILGTNRRRYGVSTRSWSGCSRRGGTDVADRLQVIALPGVFDLRRAREWTGVTRYAIRSPTSFRSE
jgi:hypothetical protein